MIVRSIDSQLTHTLIKSSHISLPHIPSSFCPTTSLSLSLSLSLAYVRIDHVDDIDISSTHAGSSLSLTCRVTTCQKEMTVSIIKGTQLVRQQKFKNENHVTVSADLTVSADTADACACHVLLPVGQVYTQRFSITGSYCTNSKPRDPHTTVCLYRCAIGYS